MRDGVSLIDGHIDQDPLYVVYDADGANTPAVYGVFTTYERAKRAIDILVEDAVNIILAAPVEETGVTEDDRQWLIKDTKRAFAIQTLRHGIDIIHYNSDIESPYA